MKDRESNKGKLLKVYFAVAVPLTAVAGFLNAVSISRVRLIHPDYPSSILLGPYVPLAPVRFYHHLGLSGLIILMVLFAFVLFAMRRRGRVSFRPMVVSTAVHIVFLFAALLSYGWCLFRLSKIP